MPPRSMPPQSVPLTEWVLTESPPGPGEVMPYMNILARKNFRLADPEDASQVLYCTCDRRRRVTKGGVDRLRWEKRYGSSRQANAALLGAWEPRDGWTDGAGTVEDLLATIARVFREADARKKTDRKNSAN